MTGKDLLPFQLFVSPDGSGTLRLSFDDGEGGIYELVSEHGTLDMNEAEEVPDDWIELRATPGLLIDLDRLEAWTDRRRLTSQDIARIDDALGESSIPEALGTMADAMDLGTTEADDDGEDDNEEKATP